MAVAIGHGRFAEAAPILVLIAAFVVGAAGGQLIAQTTGPQHLTAVLASVTLLLGLTALYDTAPLPMVAAMGGLNATMHRAGDLSVSLTYVTGSLVKFGQGLGDFVAVKQEAGAGRSRRCRGSASSLVGSSPQPPSSGRVTSSIGCRSGLAALLAASVIIPPPDQVDR